MEAILATHRYARLTVFIKRVKTLKYDKLKLYEEFTRHVNARNIKACRKMQSIEYNLALAGDLSPQKSGHLTFPSVTRQSSFYITGH